jgi:quinol monooxygenase YgiN
MVVIHATFDLDPTMRAEALDQIRSLVDASNEEPGIIDYRAGIDVHDENTVRFVEHYEDEAAFEAHLETDHYQAFEATLAEYIVDEPTVMRFEISAAHEPAFE